MNQPLTQQSIDSVCIGYSTAAHWNFFQKILTKPEIKNICMIGVYYGRDLAYISAILNALGREDYLLVGVDKFEDTACADWPEEKKGLTWEQAGFGKAPSLDNVKSNLIKLNLSGNIFLIPSLDVSFLQKTQQTFDLIYIDTSHDYQSVKKLIQLALPKLSPQGFLAGDDFSDHGTWGVASAVKDSFSDFELFYDWIWFANKDQYQKPQESKITTPLSNTSASQLPANLEVITCESDPNRKVITGQEHIFPYLLALYEKQGYTVKVGLNPWRTQNRDNSFAALLEHEYQGNQLNLKMLLTGGGIAIDEIYFFENILKLFKPKREFLIGIAAGWSTLALGLINPQAEFYGIDNCSEGSQARKGIQLTQTLAHQLNLNLKICIGSSPQDVPTFVNYYLGSYQFDFVFIDGWHTNEQVILDFEAVLPYVANSAIMVFHDVLNWDLKDGWSKIATIAESQGFKTLVLTRTSSGMAIAYRQISPEVEENILAFHQPYLINY